MEWFLLLVGGCCLFAVEEPQCFTCLSYDNDSDDDCCGMVGED